MHEVKGRSEDGVLVVIDRLRSKQHGNQGQLWSSAISGDEVPEDLAEEIRIAFVAITRARRYCAIALPSDSDEETVMTFLDAGFEQVGERGAQWAQG